MVGREQLAGSGGFQDLLGVDAATLELVELLRQLDRLLITARGQMRLSAASRPWWRRR